MTRNPKCTVCTDPRVDSIDALLLGGQPILRVAQQTGLGRGPLTRHLADHTERAEDPANLPYASGAGVNADLDALIDRLTKQQKKAPGNAALAQVLRLAIADRERLVKVDGPLVGDAAQKAMGDRLVAIVNDAVEAAMPAASAPKADHDAFQRFRAQLARGIAGQMRPEKRAAYNALHRRSDPDWEDA